MSIGIRISTDFPPPQWTGKGPSGGIVKKTCQAVDHLVVRLLYSVAHQTFPGEIAVIRQWSFLSCGRQTSRDSKNSLLSGRQQTSSRVFKLLK